MDYSEKLRVYVRWFWGELACGQQRLKQTSGVFDLCKYDRMALSTSGDRETLRKSFRPACIHLLFIGEAPPVSGRFFYSANSGLYRAMRMAFQIADSTINNETFLAAFQQRGCYLTDLCLEPVDHLAPDERRALRRNGEARLARQLRRLRPVVIAPVLRSISKNVENAVSSARWRGDIVELPYPGRWSRNREAFIQALVPILRRLDRLG
jgi:uracil DNA glycosylase superfamily protein